MDSFFADHNYSLSSFKSSSDHLSSLPTPDSAESDHEPPSEARLQSSIFDDDDQLIIGVDVNLYSGARLSDDEDLIQINPSLRTTGGERLVLPSTPNQNPCSIKVAYGRKRAAKKRTSKRNTNREVVEKVVKKPKTASKSRNLNSIARLSDDDEHFNLIPFNPSLKTTGGETLDFPPNCMIVIFGKKKEPPEVPILEDALSDDDQTQEKPESPEVENNDALDATGGKVDVVSTAVPIAGPSGLQRRVTENVVQKPETTSESEESDEKNKYYIEVILFEVTTPPQKLWVKWMGYTETTWELIINDNKNKNGIRNVTIDPNGIINVPIDAKNISMIRHRLHVRSFTAWKERHANDNFEAVLRNATISLADIRRRDIRQLFTARIDELIRDRELLVPEITKWFLFCLECYLNFVPDPLIPKGKKLAVKYTKAHLETICKLTMNLEIPN